MSKRCILNTEVKFQLFSVYYTIDEYTIILNWLTLATKRKRVYKNSYMPQNRKYIPFIGVSHSFRVTLFLRTRWKLSPLCHFNLYINFS